MDQRLNWRKAHSSQLVNRRATNGLIYQDETGAMWLPDERGMYKKQGDAALTSAAGNPVDPRLYSGMQLIEACQDASGWTTAGSPTLTALSSPLTPGGGLLQASSSGTTTLSIKRPTAFSYNPAELGVLAFMLHVTGKHTGAGLRLGSEFLTYGNNVTTKVRRDGFFPMAFHVSEFPAFFNGAPGPITPDFLLQLGGNDGLTTEVISPLYANANWKTTVSLSFDDIRPSHYTTVLPILDRLRLPATFYVPTGVIGADSNRMPLSHLQQINASPVGHVLAVNGSRDDLPLLSGSYGTVALSVQEVLANRAQLITLGLAKWGSQNHICYPTNGWNEALCAALAKVLGPNATGRTTRADPFFSRWGWGSQRLSRPSHSCGVGTFATYEEWKATFDNYRLRTADFSAHYHAVLDSGASGIDTPTQLFIQQMEEIARQRDAGEIDVLNVCDLERRVSANSLPPLLT